MTNVNKHLDKVRRRRALFAFAVATLEKEGWQVSRVPRGGKSSLREIYKGSATHRVAIRTSQDAWVAFPRTKGDKGWLTLDEVDYVVVASLDDRDEPTEARVHMIPGDDARAYFNRAYKARKASNQRVPNPGRGIWLSLYRKEEKDDAISYVGGGMGLVHKPIAVVDVDRLDTLAAGTDEDDADESDFRVDEQQAASEPPLTIAEAKRRLAKSLGVPEAAIKITIEH